MPARAQATARDFGRDPEFQEQLARMDGLVAEEVEPPAFLGIHPSDTRDAARNAPVRPPQEKVKARGLWACPWGWS